MSADLTRSVEDHIGPDVGASTVEPGLVAETLAERVVGVQPLPRLYAEAERVWVTGPAPEDLVPYQRAIGQSAARLRAWNPVNADDLAYHLAKQSDTHRTFVIHARVPVGDHDIVGKVNVTNVVRVRAQSAAMGYDAYDPYAGTGLFSEGLRLVLDLAFAPVPEGMGLHRLEACVQPGNVRSAGLLRRLGFQCRGHWPRYLWLGDAHDREDWRDHVVYGITAEEWPAPTYAPPRWDRPTVLVVRDHPGALALGHEMGVPVLPLELACAHPELAGGAPRGAVLDADGAIAQGRATDELQTLAESVLQRAGVPAESLFVCRVSPLAGSSDVVRAALAAAAYAHR